MFTAAYLGWDGLKNGALLRRAADNGFDALVTNDREIQYQQHVGKLPVAVVIIHPRRDATDDVKALVPALLVALSRLRPRQLIHVPAP